MRSDRAGELGLTSSLLSGSVLTKTVAKATNRGACELLRASV